jgi:protein-S-isoprenylcysteine O-methyltransferase Ste14
MPKNATPALEPKGRKGPSSWLRVRGLFMVLLWVGMCFAGAGSLTWTRGWIGVAVYLVASGCLTVLISRINPGLLQQREKWLRNDTWPFDRIVLIVYVLLSYIEVFVAGLDAGRFRWMALPGWTLAPGIILFVAAMAMVCWTMVTNPFAETTLRLQTDRGHSVVESGPYRIVRHPMYLGFAMQNLAAAFMLGSGWAIIVSAPVVATLIARTAHEDRFLRARLSGYSDFAQRSRFRLIPLIW